LGGASNEAALDGRREAVDLFSDGSGRGSPIREGARLEAEEDRAEA